VKATERRRQARSAASAAPILYPLTEDGPALQARLMDELDPQLNEIRPKDA
jgi:hypothetical protein